MSARSGCTSCTDRRLFVLTEQVIALEENERLIAGIIQSGCCDHFTAQSLWDALHKMKAHHAKVEAQVNRLNENKRRIQPRQTGGEA